MSLCLRRASLVLSLSLATACGSGGSSVDLGDLVDGAQAAVDLSTAPDLATISVDAGTCSDLVQNGDETDIDCGGRCGATCIEGKRCTGVGDCAMGVCGSAPGITHVVCVAPSCHDGFQNGDESDVDCGGSCAARCALGATCGAHADCASKHCEELVCVIPTCAQGAGCDAHADCADDVAGAICTCQAGWDGDGHSCVDVDECADNNGGCGIHGSCVNSPGSSTCACDPGYAGKPCADIDECADNHGGCAAEATCSNTPAGSHTCTCPAGSYGDGVTCVACVPGQSVYSYTGVDQFFVVPAGCTHLTVTMWGGGGAGAIYGTLGGGGGYAQATVETTPTTSFVVQVGGGGKIYSPSNAVTIYRGGGPGFGGCGHGGGYSAFFDGEDQFDVYSASTLIVAGGGGSGGVWAGADGGGGGGTVGQDGYTATPPYAATGGTQSAGGTPNYGCAGHNVTSGSMFLGGLGSYVQGPGGGGGYYGGGGACGTSGSGGGSGTLQGVSGGTMETGSGTTPGGTSDPLYTASTAQGGAVGAFGNAGKIIVAYK